MKSSASPSSTAIASMLIISMLLVLLLVTSSSAAATRLPKSTSRIHYRHRFDRRKPPSCGSFPHKNSRSLCIHFQRMNPNRRLTPPPPPSTPAEIDPRYGVEKRLVPSGPNPLHN